VSVFLAYASRRGQALLVDREVYLPRSWTDDPPPVKVASL
jgi:hypothetical protein